MTPTSLPCGSWPTPITADVVVRSARQVTAVQLDGPDLYWSELRPDEGGRIALVRLRDGITEDVLPAEVNVRTAVHEYGGGAWWVHRGVIWFVDWADQRLRRVEPGSEPVAVGPHEDGADVRWADGHLNPVDGRLAVVRETHPAGTESAAAVRNELVVLAGDTLEVLVAGPDFVSDPRWSPDGRSLCWLEWDHPNMPWDESRLMVRLPNGQVVRVAGGDDEGVNQPRWAPDGSLWFCSDRHDWWTLFCWTPGQGAVQMIEEPGDIGAPQWVLGTSTFGILSDGRVVFSVLRDGTATVRLRAVDGTVSSLATGTTSTRMLVAHGDRIALVGGSPTQETTVSLVDPVSGTAEPVLESRDLGVDPSWFSRPRHVQFTGGDGRPSYAQYYPPNNPGFVPMSDELPPLLVILHGGPTSNATTELDLKIQFWTSRGFAVADVDYGGSTGYGRSSRNRLWGQWGVLDVADCIAAAQHLAEQGLADASRCLIRGGSAGGFTTLMALATSETFAAGADYFGVADLEGLAQDTHKFESRYLDRLVAPYPEGREVYRARSPLTHIEGLTAPLIVLQGAEDRVVPPDQSEVIVTALRENGVPVAYRLYEGEQHGFRKAENIADSLNAELSFYAQVLGFPLPEEEGIDPVQIENLHR